MMNRIVFFSISILLFSTLAAPKINAQGLENIVNIEPKQENAKNRLSQSALVNAARQGRL